MGNGAQILLRDAGVLPAWAGPSAAALLGILFGCLVATTPAVLYFTSEPGWALFVPAALWSLVVVLIASRGLSRDPPGALGLLRVGGAGLLLLITLAAPTVLARQQSGRDLFLPARGREVIVWGAWRTAWMSGYFYNDGRVREVTDLPAIVEAASGGPVLVLAGPSQRRRLEAISSLRLLPLATGVRGDTLLRVENASGAASPTGN
jgi:hypothetical protein